MYPPQRVTRHGWKTDSCWRPRSGIYGDYVFCHNDLVPDNVVVDPETLKVKAVLDWEFGGFWPEWFERTFGERRGPDSTLDGEEDDVERCRKWLLENYDEVPMTRLQLAIERVAKPAKEVEAYNDMICIYMMVLQQTRLAAYLNVSTTSNLSMLKRYHVFLSLSSFSFCFVAAQVRQSA